MLKRFLLLSLSLLVALPLQAAKPTSPLKVVLESTAKPQSLEELQLSATVSSRVALKNVEVSVSLPENALLIAGEQKQTIDLSPGNAVELNYRIKMAEQLEGQIRIQVHSGSQHSVNYLAQDVIVLDKASAKASVRGAVITPYSYRERNGEKIRQYSLP